MIQKLFSLDTFNRTNENYLCFYVNKLITDKNLRIRNIVKSNNSVNNYRGL